MTCHSAPARDWAASAVERCVALCCCAAPRYARHLRRAQSRRDPLDDLLVLAARRQSPLPRRVLRPLPGATLPAAALSFNALDRADRRALLAAFEPAPSAAGPGERAPAAARGEHAASALARLVASMRARERLAREQARPPP
jgi:hypothetical protein